MQGRKNLALPASSGYEYRFLARPGTEETTPDAGEPENRASQAAEPAQAASIRQEGAKKAGGGAGIIAILSVLAAVACGGIWFWKRKRSM